jgi:hypothetical protein
VKGLSPDQSIAKSRNDWQKTQFANLVRYVPSGTYYARLRVQGKLVRRSLKTKAISVAKLRLSELEKRERRLADHQRPSAKGTITLGSPGCPYGTQGTTISFSSLCSSAQRTFELRFTLLQMSPPTPRL